VDHVGRIGRAHVVECRDQLGGALGRLLPGETGDVTPLDHVGLPLAPEALARLLDGDAREHPVAGARLLHRDVVDDAGDAALLRRVVDGDRAVEHLAHHQRLRRTLLEPAHVEQAGGVHLAAVDVGDAGHRYEDPPAAEDLGDHAEHPRLARLGTKRDDQVAHLGHLVALGVEDR